MLKICDLGTAIDRSDAATAHTEITPYLVSRFYRAPEIILGMPYDYAVDMWSIGCTLYELYTGKILFTGDSNNQMLKAIMEIRGRLTPKLFKRGQLAGVHFDDMGQFVSVERDKVLNKVCSGLFLFMLLFLYPPFPCHNIQAPFTFPRPSVHGLFCFSIFDEGCMGAVGLGLGLCERKRLGCIPYSRSAQTFVGSVRFSQRHPVNTILEILDLDLFRGPATWAIQMR